MDELQWSMLVEWTVRLGAWALAAVSARRRGAHDPYTELTQALRQLPAGSEAGGTLANGATWYVRVPPAGREERRDDH